MLWTDAGKDKYGANRWRWDSGRNMVKGYVPKYENTGNFTQLLGFVNGADDANCIEYVRNAGNEFGKLGKRPCANDCPIICRL